ncbi:MAG: UbiA family prenyltransferase [Candidatus Moranbacteria bacterium]|jgi:4-hydroxybenzoate polyprenyltransferase|nr:UbiA family prenyltransferase [Candidatus Moranbacteria bacterium]
MFKKLVDLVEKIEKTSTNFYLWSLTFLSIIFARVLMENWLGKMINRSGDYFFHHFSYTLVFFLLSYLLFLAFLMKKLDLKIKAASNVMLWGYLIIIFPPLFDFILLNDRPYLSFYGIYSLSEMPYRFFTFFGDSPDYGMTYGVRIEIAFTVLALLVYAFIKTRDKIKALIISIEAYLILFFLGTFPSWMTILVRGFQKGPLNVAESDIVQLFFPSVRLFARSTGSYLNALSIKLSLVYGFILFLFVCWGLYVLYRKQFLAFLKNARPVQLGYHIGLLLAGMFLAVAFTRINWDLNIFNIFALLLVMVSVAFAWLASVVVNDIYDKKIDHLTNQTRPLIVKDFSNEAYITAGVVLFAVSIFFSAMVSPKVAFLLMAYQALAFFYSAWPFRLKRFLGVASLVSSIASLLILFAGFILAAPMEDIGQLPTRIIWLLGVAFIFCLPIKDLKDIKGDKADGVMTFPVVFGEYWGKVIIGGGIFFAYVFSVIAFNEKKLLLWALFLGGVSFWLVVISKERGQKITNRNVIWWAMGVLAIYIFLLWRFVFVS